MKFHKIIQSLSLIYIMTIVSIAQNKTPIPKGTAVYNDIAYVSNGHERQKLDLYIPESVKKLPLIIRIHGGAWRKGDKVPAPIGYLNDGYAVASINYRLSQDALFPAQIEDCKSAIRWLRANAEKYNLNPGKFGVIGTSSGGHLVALLGTTDDIKIFDVGEYLNESSAVQAVVDNYGPTDFLQMDDHLIPGAMAHNVPGSPESQLVGGLIQEKKEMVKKANPITYVNKNDAPFLIIHGDADPSVPHHQSEILESALKKAGVPVKLYTVKGGGHGKFNDPEVPILTKEFFSKHLKEK